MPSIGMRTGQAAGLMKSFCLSLKRRRRTRNGMASRASRWDVWHSYLSMQLCVGTVNGCFLHMADRKKDMIRCCLCGRMIWPGLEMWTTIDGKCLPCHRDCGVPVAQARPETIHHLEWKYSTRKKTRKQRKRDRNETDENNDHS